MWSTSDTIRSFLTLLTSTNDCVHCRNLGWRWTQWTMAILTLSTFVLLLFCFPETQYTRSTKDNRNRRDFTDNFRFWRVSGGGKPKVHRYRYANNIHSTIRKLIRSSFVAAFVFPFRYIVHPVVLMSTAFFSLYLVTTNYLLVSATCRPHSNVAYLSSLW